MVTQHYLCCIVWVLIFWQGYILCTLSCHKGMKPLLCKYSQTGVTWTTSCPLSSFPSSDEANVALDLCNLNPGNTRLCDFRMQGFNLTVTTSMPTVMKNKSMSFYYLKKCVHLKMSSTTVALLLATDRRSLLLISTKSSRLDTNVHLYSLNDWDLKTIKNYIFLFQRTGF